MDDHGTYNSLATLISLSEELKGKMQKKQKEILGLRTEFEYMRRQYNDLKIIINKLENEIQ